MRIGRFSMLAMYNPASSKLKDAQTFPSAMVIIQTLDQNTTVFVLQNHFSDLHICVIRLEARSYQERGAHSVFHEFHSPEPNELLLVFLLKRDGKVQDCFHEMRRRDLGTKNPKPHFCALNQLNHFPVPQ